MTIKISLLFLAITLIVRCNFSQEKGILSNYRITDSSNEIIKLPKELNEISGLASIGSKNILMHNDEENTVYVFNINEKKLIRKIIPGGNKFNDDFEGIAFYKDTIYLMTSGGKIYSFLLSKNYPEIISINKLNGNDKKDFEGFCYDYHTGTLLIANKIEPGKNIKDERIIISYDPERKKFSKSPVIRIKLKELKKKFGIENFSPTALEINPLNKHIFILSSHEKCIIETTHNGDILNCEKLNHKEHPQPEGLTFLEDLTMIISDEAAGGNAKLTIIPFNK